MHGYDAISFGTGLHCWRMQDFRQLLVWQRAHELTLAIKQIVRTFPKSGYGDLKSQILRATDSTVSNIVEGCGAATRKEFGRYLDISIKSASEVDYRLQLARDDGCLAYRAWLPLSEQIVEIRKKLFALRRAVIAADRDDERRRATKRRCGPMTDDQRPMTDDRELTTGENEPRCRYHQAPAPVAAGRERQSRPRRAGREFAVMRRWSSVIGPMGRPSSAPAIARSGCDHGCNLAGPTGWPHYT